VGENGKELKEVRHTKRESQNQAEEDTQNYPFGNPWLPYTKDGKPIIGQEHDGQLLQHIVDAVAEDKNRQNSAKEAQPAITE
jgi:hypothetical protein